MDDFQLIEPTGTVENREVHGQHRYVGRGNVVLYVRNDIAPENHRIIKRFCWLHRPHYGPYKDI